MQTRFPIFRLRIIAVNQKNLPSPQCENAIVAQIDQIIKSMDKSDMIIGYDLVAEEDFCPGLEKFLKHLYDGRIKAAKKGKRLEFFLHAG